MRAGGPEDFEAWYGREHPRLVRTLTVAAADRRVAEDITSEAFARALERWDRVSAMDSPTGWTYRVAINLLRRHQRRTRREPTSTVIDPAWGVTDSVESDPELWRAVRALPRQMRLAIAFRYVTDLTEAEVAAAMGIATGTASATLAAARKRLARSLLPEPMEHEVGRHD
jgi:RNA polymerase sigma factor (sigma-70 family)